MLLTSAPSSARTRSGRRSRVPASPARAAARTSFGFAAHTRLIVRQAIAAASPVAPSEARRAAFGPFHGEAETVAQKILFSAWRAPLACFFWLSRSDVL